MALLKYLLLPFAWLYDLVTSIRNYLYDIGHKKSFQFEVPVISVGNLNAGGSGKTPMVEYLVRLLADQYKLATLSRGYGRATKGFRVAGEQDDARSIGDEPFQVFRKFNDRIMVTVGEERVLAIPTILNEDPDVQVILLDDAFQHRSVVPQFSILVTDFEKPFYTDFLLPYGRLREARKGAKRADVIVVTKCPSLDTSAQEQIKKEIGKVVDDVPVFFSTLQYELPKGIGHDRTISQKILLVSAIAKPAYFEKEARRLYEVHHHVQFPDHHRYTASDLKKIHETASAAGIDSILTTEKDMVKLIGPEFHALLEGKNWFYLPVKAVFLQNGSEFDTMVRRMVDASPDSRIV